MEDSVNEPGPPTREPTGVIPLMPFSKPMGFELPLYATHAVWEAVVRHSPYALASKVANVVGNALSSQRADYAVIPFSFRYDEEEGGKAKKVRLRLELYQTSEGIPWVMLTSAPPRSMPGHSGG